METTWRGRTVQGCLLLLGGLSALALVGLCIAFAFLGGFGIFVGHAVTNAPTPTRIGGYSATTLGQLPEAQLTYPGANVLNRYADERISGFGKPWYAVAGLLAGAQASAADVEGWYDQQLRASGWQSSTGNGSAGSSPQQRTVQWQRGDLLFQLTFLTREQLATGTAGQSATYTTAFTIEITPRR